MRFFARASAVLAAATVLGIRLPSLPRFPAEAARAGAADAGGGGWPSRLTWGPPAADASRPAAPGAGTIRPLTPFETAKATALLRDRLACLGCHSLGTEGGRVAPDLATARARLTPAAIATMIADPARVRPGTAMPRVPMPEQTRALVTAFVIGSWDGAQPVVRPGAASAARAGAARGAPPEHHDTPAGVTARDPSNARGGLATPAPAAGSSPLAAGPLYARYCAACHGTSGRGDGPNARYLPVPPANHASREAMGARTDDRLYDAIAAGGHPLGRSPRMPPFGETLSRAEIRALVRHIRALCRCEGPAWSRDGR